ncbi:hypothetical protein D3874_25210 [Oleomonas cavernae]|uniref:Tetratricopeptide repeat protein n=1 Tax=Oleomonas cavernae TaxID=2320859 RepID=A0A418VZG8_9PROT|nr:hypothetical protein [Oleomonas cavernae]RJF82758.1 hypothetical protein D3874_25210 [Oleomonas cavernae]
MDSIRAEAAKLGDEHPKIAKVKECEASLLVALGQNDDAIAVFNDLLAKLPRKPRRKRVKAAKKKLVYLARLLNIFETILRAGERSQRAAVKQQLLGVVQANLPVVSKSLEEMRLRVGFMKLGMGRDHTINFLDAQAKGPFGDEAAMEALKLAIEQFISDPHGSLYESIAGRLNRKRQAKWWSLRAKPLSETWLLGNAILHAYFTRETAKGLRPADLRTGTMAQVTQTYIAKASIFGRPRLSRLVPLIGEETIWSDVYDGAEETKRLITDALFNAAFTKGRAQDAEVTEDLRLKIARCATCLQGFWQQADLREDLLGRLEEAWSGIDTPRAFVVRGQIAVVRNEHDRAEQLFMTAEERDTRQGLTGSGHSTFISPDRVKLRDFGIDNSPFSADACKFELKFADEADGDGPVAVTSADPIYFRRYAVPYATSLWALAPRMPIHFHVLGDLGNVENTLVALGRPAAPSPSRPRPPQSPSRITMPLPASCAPRNSCGCSSGP